MGAIAGKASAKLWKMSSKLAGHDKGCGFVRKAKVGEQWKNVELTNNYGGFLKNIQFKTDTMPTGDTIQKVVFTFIDQATGELELMEATMNFTTISLLNSMAALGAEAQGAYIALSIYKKDPIKDRVAAISVTANDGRLSWKYDYDALVKHKLTYGKATGEDKETVFTRWQALYDKNIISKFDPTFSLEIEKKSQASLDAIEEVEDEDDGADFVEQFPKTDAVVATDDMDDLPF